MNADNFEMCSRQKQSSDRRMNWTGAVAFFAAAASSCPSFAGAACCPAPDISPSAPENSCTAALGRSASPETVLYSANSIPAPAFEATMRSNALSFTTPVAASAAAESLPFFVRRSVATTMNDGWNSSVFFDSSASVFTNNSTSSLDFRTSPECTSTTSNLSPSFISSQMPSSFALYSPTFSSLIANSIRPGFFSPSTPACGRNFTANFSTLFVSTKLCVSSSTSCGQKSSTEKFPDTNCSFR
mmetsp:Transcript_18751/g.46869  ORF Transcript_18751/g.46869 Transcript_18751/m.46869 type:complete len:243 (-) Transcript_18751:4959-5687(-)